MYYDGTKLLSLQDINGKRPELYFVTSNRSAGKTTFFSKMCVNKFIKNHEQFGLIYRFKYELDDCSDKFFKDIQSLFFPKYELKSNPIDNGAVRELILSRVNDETYSRVCGYALSLNSAEDVKKHSHLMKDVKRLLFDEFQSETNHYCQNEINKFTSIHFSLARGHGEAVRYLPVILISNPVSLINPYYTALKISGKLKGNTKFLRGDGFVVEQGHNESVAAQQSESGFNRAFAGSKYLKYSIYSDYLNDSKAFIEKPSGKNKYICTIKDNDREYCIREYPDEGLIYCGLEVDGSFPLKLSLTTDSHDINYIMIRNNPVLIANLRYYFERGCFRFKDLNCKDVITQLVGYR